MEDKSLNYDKFITLAKSRLVDYFEIHKLSSDSSLQKLYPGLFDSLKKSERFHGLEKNANEDITQSISMLYEQSFTKEQRKDYGQFYTNNLDVISLMLDDVNLLAGKILEPSCGSGLFMSEITKKLISLLKAKQYEDKDILDYVLSNLYGNDIDAMACELAEINVVSALMPLFINLSKNPGFTNKKRLVFFNKDFIEKNQFNDFALIIGNPPFVTLYGKRSRNMNEEKRAFYNTFDFVQNKKGNNKFNVSMFFIENGLKALNVGGILYYVLDISFFETAFIDMRKYLLSNYSIEKIVTGLREFEGVASGQLLLKIRKCSGLNSACNWVEFETKDSTTIKQSLWLSDEPKYRIGKPSNGLEKTIIDKIEEGRPLSFYYPDKCLRTCCALTGKTDEFIVDPNVEKDHLVLPYLEGSKGLQEKFGMPSAERYIKYDYDLQIKLSDEFKAELELLGVKNKKRVTLGDKDMYISPKLFIRQSAFELISTYTDKPFAANNSLYVLSKKSNEPEDINMLKYTCGVLNSDLMTFYALSKRIIRADKGKTPQIKTSDLKEVRIIINEKYHEIITVVDKLLLDNDKALLKKLNELIYTVYNISDEEISFINSYLKQ